MVLLAAAICTKDGKALVSRQFVEMSKSRIEGLIATFPKLADPGKQHTFVETDSVRYVYQPLERLYVLLITTKASNILEDLETLRLFARVIPEYARGSDASDIVENAFQIIFAFDEIVALGYRESVTLSQIRTFTEMDSHEEKMFNAVRENQMQEARELSKRKARELELARQAAAKQGLPPNYIYNTFSSISRVGGDAFGSTPSVEPSVDDYSTPLLSNQGRSETSVPRRGMQLGGGRGGMGLGGQSRSEMEKLTEMIRAEVPASAAGGANGATTAADTDISGAGAMQSLHVRLEERMTARANREGGIDCLEVGGVLHVRANEERCVTSRLHIDLAGNRSTPPAFQTHPNMDKATFASSHWLAIKPGGKPFLLGKELAVLKWRSQGAVSESSLPVLINCWPAEIPGGGFEVNVEYNLQDTAMELKNFCITIPLPPGMKQPPVVTSCDGDYEADARNGELRWTRPLVDADSATGNLEFTVRAPGAKADAFFPVTLDFVGDKTSYCGVRVVEATDSNGEPIKFSSEVNFHPERYEIV